MNKTIPIEITKADKSQFVLYGEAEFEDDGLNLRITIYGYQGRLILRDLEDGLVIRRETK